jgi:hypothetical protein
MVGARWLHGAVLLGNGKALVAGGYNSGYLSTAELYDPAIGTWTSTASLNVARGYATLVLLANGNALFPAGYNSGTFMSTADLYDVGLGFNSSWQPQITSITPPFSSGGSLVLAGSRYRGLSEASGGNGPQDSPSDHPVVQWRSLESGQTVFLSSTNWSTNAFVSLSVGSLPPGFALVNVSVNGIPSPSVISVSSPRPNPFNLGGLKVNSGVFQLSFSSTPNARFTVLGSADLTQPATNWPVLGSMTEVSAGQFQFTDNSASNAPVRFYYVRSP